MEKSQQVEEAVKNLVSVIADAVTDTTDTQDKEQPSHTTTSYYKEGVPFVLELKFEKWTPETESLLMKTFMHDEELLKGLKITKMYRTTLTTESLYLENISKKLDEIKTEVDNYRAACELKMKKKLREAK